MFWIKISCILFFALFVSAEEIEEKGTNRDSKVLPLFQVIRFPNDICTGTTRNGTCYTSEECSNKGGKNGGSCASGFGVCCIFELSCGGSSSDNLTFLAQASATTITSPCSYTICPLSTNICRIRYDFTTFVIATQTTGTTGAVNIDAAMQNGRVGSCSTDAFSITSPGEVGSPVICGTNTGAHMIVDVDAPNCQDATFMIGGTGTTRQWDIQVTQYACGDSNAGPDGCLQYITGTFGTINSFGYNSVADTTAMDTTTHLKNQRYTACFRREKGFCTLCYSPTVVAAAAAATNAATSFGLSLSPNAAAKAGVGTACLADYISIPNAFAQAAAAIVSGIAVTADDNLAIAYTTTQVGVNHICGRVFNVADAAETVSICTRQTPFRLGVNFDGSEAATVKTDATTSELGIFPGGIVGFRLTYHQVAC